MANETGAATSSEKTYGFNCPPDLLPYWDPKQCEIVPTTEGDWGLLDHGIQTLVYLGRTKEMCESFLATS